jgi:hypothetical protein
MKKLKYISNEEFKKMSLSKKLKMPVANFVASDLLSIVLIPTQNKNEDNYTLGAFFGKTENGWLKIDEYENCLINVNGPLLRMNMDFEYGGVRIMPPFASKQKLEYFCGCVAVK